MKLAELLDQNAATVLAEGWHLYKASRATYAAAFQALGSAPAQRVAEVLASPNGAPYLVEAWAEFIAEYAMGTTKAQASKRAGKGKATPAQVKAFIDAYEAQHRTRYGAIKAACARFGIGRSRVAELLRQFN